MTAPLTAVLAITSEQIKMLSVYSRVKMLEDGKPDLRMWARMSSLPLRRVRTLARALEEMGVIFPDGTMDRNVQKYINKLSGQKFGMSNSG